MGCTASKLENEDTVRRCKERRRLIKETVFARHHLASAHSDYCRFLRLTGDSLLHFSSLHPLLSVSPSTPSVLLPSTPPSLSSTSSIPPPPSPAPSSVFQPPQPPPPPPEFISAAPPPPQRNFRKKPSMKIPHILSDSSISSTPRNHRATFDFPATAYVANSNYASTPSQASSVWNWENFYPPSPPGSDFFSKPEPEPKTKSTFSHYSKHHHLSDDEDEDEVERETEMEREREEVHCSEWGDHYSTSSSSSGSGDGDDERDARSEISEMPSEAARSHYGSEPVGPGPGRFRSSSSVRSEPVGRTQFGGSDTSSVRSEPMMMKVPPPVRTRMQRVDERSEDDGGSEASSSMRWKSSGNGNGNGGMNGNGGKGEVSGDVRIVVRHKDLKEIVMSLKDYFDLAASSGDQVSEMLEAGRAQLDRSFSQLKKTVYHSSGVLSNLSSSWTSKPPLAVKYRLDATALNDPGGPKSLCSTLERLLAWEKKLYEEVKAREGVKIEHEKKLATLQSQEYKGGDDIKLDKTKASIKKLQSLIVVTSQAANTTSSAIVGLRDSDLIPQLVELCHGMMYMWRSMNQFHEVQNQVVQQVRGLVNQPIKGDATSELHRQATRDLESAVSAWHSAFCRLIKYQRDFIRSLHGWFKLTLIPVDDQQQTPEMVKMSLASDAFSFVDEWKLALDRLPDTVASEAIKSFVNVVHVISVKQSEEFKIKKRTETISKELEKKSSALRNIEKKYYHSYSMVGVGFPDSGPDNGQVLDARDPLAEKKAELAACQRRVEDEMLKHSKAVEVTRAMTLNNIQTGLPGVFQALTSFSSLFKGALETACTRSYSIK